MSEGENWLEIPDGATIESAKKLTRDQERGRTMMRGFMGTDRVWGCDGEYIYFRRKSCEGPPVRHETLNRHEAFLARGHYKYVGTWDDVEVYELLEGSPFKRNAAVDLYSIDLPNLRRVAIRAACAHDWPTYVDALEEVASRIKSRYHSDYAAQEYENHLAHIENMVRLRGGPGRPIRDAQVQNVMRKRGQGRGRRIILPP